MNETAFVSMVFCYDLPPAWRYVGSIILRFLIALKIHFGGKSKDKNNSPICNSIKTGNKIVPLAATWMDLEIVIQWSKSERKRQISYNITYMWNLEKWYRWSCLQNRNRDTDVENKCMDTKGGRGRDELGDWDWHIYAIDTMHKIDDRWEPNSTAQGTLLSVLWWPKWEGNLKKRGYMYMCSWFTLLHSRK